MKKVLCFMLILLLMFDTTFSYTIYAIGFQPSQEEVEKFKQDALATGMWYEGDDGYLYPKDTAADKLRKFVEHGITVPKLAGVGAVKIAEVLSSFFGNADNYQKNVKTDGQYVYFDNDFTNNINIALQDKVHALDGYYLIDSDDSILSFDDIFDKYWSRFTKPTGDTLTKIRNVWSKINCRTVFVGFSGSHVFISYYDPTLYAGATNAPSDCNLAFYPGNNIAYYKNNENIYHGSSTGYSFSDDYLYPHSFSIPSQSKFLELYSDSKSRDGLILGDSVKYFYSKDDYFRYLNQGRTYIPKLPSGGFKINIKYINNTTSLPDITYNITTENKTETEIQNQYDTTINNYFNSLDNFSDGSDLTPTPTPGGGFDDGATPTPTPPLSDGSLTPSPAPGSGADMTETNSWLQKIYELLQKFYDSYSEFTKKISDSLENNDAFFKKVSEYLESHDRKLDEIVDAIDKLSQGKEEGEEKGCKYDYTELSGFMTKLWNDSDQKFDTMIDLLKENNAYQEKLVSTLNSIKNILKAQSVMDSFKNRSQETANKAKEKFPTSVPWDVAMVVNAMSADPKEPVFVLPVKITRLGIDEEIKVDLSTGEWEKLAKACRYMLSLLFILFMIKLTIKLFGGKGDD